MSNLTRDEILAMGAGPGMDAIVHRRVLRRPLLEWHGRQGWVSTPTARSIPAYSTDIAAAWEVFEWLYERLSDVRDKARARECFFDRMILQMGKEGGAYWCGYSRVVDYEGEIDYLSGVGLTAPLAICRCALLVTLTEEGRHEND